MIVIWLFIFSNIFWFCSASVASYYLFGDFDTIFRFVYSLNIIFFCLFLSYIIFITLPLYITFLILKNTQKRNKK